MSSKPALWARWMLQASTSLRDYRTKYLSTRNCQGATSTNKEPVLSNSQERLGSAGLVDLRRVVAAFGSNSLIGTHLR
jgi:hypothetical protein